MFKFKLIVGVQLFFLVGFLMSQEAPTTVTFGDYTISIIQKNSPDGGILDIAYTPYQLYKITNLITHRYQGPKDPLGPRDDWANIPDHNLPEWSDFSDLINADTFHVNLDTKSSNNWYKLTKIDGLVIEYLARNQLRKFIENYSAAIHKTIMSLRLEIGSPIPYPFLHDANLQRRNQFALEEAYKLLTNKENYFSPKNIFDQLFISMNIPKSFPKALTITQPIIKHPLIVVHASEAFDTDQSAKAGIDRQIQKFKNNQQPVIYLMHHDGMSDLQWYPSDKNSTFTIFSAGGEHNLPLYDSSVTIVGGFFGDYDGSRGCHFKAMADAITRYYLHGKSPFKIYLPVDSIYFYNDDTITRDEFLTDQISPVDFIEDIHESFFFTEDKEYLGGSTQYIGLITTSDYTFNYYVKNKLIKEYGNGPRVVEFYFK